MEPDLIVIPAAVQGATVFNVDALLTHWNVLLMIAVWVGVQSLRQAMPDEWFGKGRPLARLLPLAPILICCVAVWIPGPWLDPSETAGQRIILGVVLGALTANLHTILSRMGVHALVANALSRGKTPPDDEAPAP